MFRIAIRLGRNGAGNVVDAQELCEEVAAWAGEQHDLKALALVGSHARGAARGTSDVDLILLTENPQTYFDDVAWIRKFGNPLRWESEDWGNIRSLRVWYESGLEVEFGVGDLDWAAPPVDEGTRRVILDGIKVLFDREGFLTDRVHRICS
jgi:predicted nucleotidyltransferase